MQGISSSQVSSVPEQTLLKHLSSIVQALESSHPSVFGENRQFPVDGTHESVVHTLLSLQVL